MVLPRFIRAAQQALPLKVYGDGQQSRCFCYVSDTVEALWRLHRCNKAKGEVFNVGGTEEISMRRLADRVIQLLQSPSPIEMVPYTQAYAPGFEDMRRRKPNISKLCGFTGFAPATSLDEIIRRTAGI
jgi:UDP-glucose 4-epimerase